MFVANKKQEVYFTTQPESVKKIVDDVSALLAETPKWRDSLEENDHLTCILPSNKTPLSHDNLNRSTVSQVKGHRLAHISHIPYDDGNSIAVVFDEKTTSTTRHYSIAKFIEQLRVAASIRKEPFVKATRLDNSALASDILCFLFDGKIPHS